MKTILVSGTSGIIGYGILRSLRKSEKKLKLVGTTIYPDSVAEGFCDIFEQAPLTNDPDYIEWLKHIIHKHQVDLVIPGIEADMYKWSESITEIENSGSKVLINNVELISLCKDKWIFYERLKQNNSPFDIETTLDKDFETLVNKFSLPFLLKPRCGHGSKGIVIVENIDVFLRHQNNIGKILMVQPIVGDENEEYTTSAFCDGNGNYFTSMTLKRKLSKDGYTEKAEVADIENINDVLIPLCKIFRPFGPTNFQFRKHNGVLKLLEINPRISSSTSIRAGFGYNESLMAAEYFLEGKMPVQPLIKKGKAVRYIEDFIFFE